MDYKEKLEEAKRLYKTSNTDQKYVLESLFPELAESKDERIRKVIYGWIYTKPLQFFENGFSKEEMLAWLEKQGEQKCVDDTDKVQKIRNEVARIQLYTQSEVLKQILDYIDMVQKESI